MTTNKVYYGWEDSGKFFLSVFRRGPRKPPALEFATRDELDAEAKKRGREVVWSDG